MPHLRLVTDADAAVAQPLRPARWPAWRYQARSRRRQLVAPGITFKPLARLR